MEKCLVYLFFLFSAFTCGLCLNCYATDLSKLQRARRPGDLEHPLQDCHEYLRSLLEKQGMGDRELPDNIPLKCFSVKVETDAVDVTVKGCIPEGGCSMMKSMMRSMFRAQNSVHLDDVKCSECGSNSCNS